MFNSQFFYKFRFKKDEFFEPFIQLDIFVCLSVSLYVDIFEKNVCFYLEYILKMKPLIFLS